MSSPVVHSNSLSIFSQALQSNLALGTTMPFSTRAFAEVTAWRELKYIDGSLNIGDRVLASAASAVIAVVSLAEAAVRYIFCFLLLPINFIGDKGNERYIAFLNGAALNSATPLLAAAGTIGFLFPFNALSKSDSSCDPKAREQGTVAEIQAMRDAFRGKFY